MTSWLIKADRHLPALIVATLYCNVALRLKVIVTHYILYDYIISFAQK